jgi:hypothetical protein
MNEFSENLKIQLNREMYLMAPYTGLGLVAMSVGTATSRIPGETFMYLSLIFIFWSFLKHSFVYFEKSEILDWHNIRLSKLLMMYIGIGLLPRTVLYFSGNRLYLSVYNAWGVIGAAITILMYFIYLGESRKLPSEEIFLLAVTSLISGLVLLVGFFSLSRGRGISIVGELFLMFILVYPFLIYPMLVCKVMDAE